MKKKLIKGFSLIVLVNIIGGVLLFIQFKKSDKEITHIEMELNQILEMSEKLSANTDKIQIKLYKIKSKENIYIDTLINYVEDSDSALNILKNLKDIQPKITTANNLSNTLESFKSTVSRIVTTNDKDVINKLNRKALEESLQMRELIDDLRVYVNRHAEEERTNAFIAIKYYPVIFIIVLVSVVIISVFIIKTTVDKISKPVQLLIDGTNKIANGDFSHRINISGSIDEITKLAGSFNHMAEDLGEIEEKKIEAIKQLVVTIDDKINNKLTGILTSVEVILSNPQNIPDDILDVLGKIKESVQEINNTITKLNNLKKVITTDYIKGIKMLSIDE